MAESALTAKAAGPDQFMVEFLLHARSTIEGARSERLGFWTHWAQCAEMFLPRRYKWFITQGQSQRGNQINQTIVDETGVLAARILSSGMMSGLSSPIAPWFRLGLHDLDEVPFGLVKDWLAECERRMGRVLAESNFYTSLGTLYHDNGVFGSAALIVYEDPEEVIRCQNPCLGEFFFMASARGTVTSFAREFTYTVKQTVEQFGLENCSENVARLWRQGGGARGQEVILYHLIEPNTELYSSSDYEQTLGWPVPKKFGYREMYWETGCNPGCFLEVKGFNEQPFVGARWDVTSNDSYGRSPGMDGLPACRQLQVQTRRLAEAIDKIVRPPMNASVNMKNEPASILPGAVNYVADLSGSGFKPAYQIDPRLAEMTANLAEVQNRLKSIFFVDLFMMISELNTVRTATEIDARREEKLIQLGPVIERFENEVLDPLLTRIFAIMARRGLFPDPPPELGSIVNLRIQYISMLAEAKRIASATSTERFYAFLGNLGAIKPDVLDIPDDDVLVRDYADRLSVIPTGIRSDAAVAALRTQKAQAAKQEQAAQLSLAGVQAAQTLSKTEVGGGKNALESMLG